MQGKAWRKHRWKQVSLHTLPLAPADTVVLMTDTQHLHRCLSIATLTDHCCQEGGVIAYGRDGDAPRVLDSHLERAEFETGFYLQGMWKAPESEGRSLGGIQGVQRHSGRECPQVHDFRFAGPAHHAQLVLHHTAALQVALWVRAMAGYDAQSSHRGKVCSDHPPELRPTSLVPPPLLPA